MFRQYLFRLAIVVLSTASANLFAQEVHERSVSYDLPAGRLVRMDLSAGEYAIRGVAVAKLRVIWSSANAMATDNVKVRFITERDQAKLETDRTKKVKVTIELPMRSDLYVR